MCCSGGWCEAGMRVLGTWGQGRVRRQGGNSIFGRCLLPSRVIYTQSMSISRGVMGVGGWTDRSLYLSGVGRGVIALGEPLRCLVWSVFLSLFFYSIKK